MEDLQVGYKARAVAYRGQAQKRPARTLNN